MKSLFGKITTTLFFLELMVSLLTVWHVCL